MPYYIKESRLWDLFMRDLRDLSVHTQLKMASARAVEMSGGVLHIRPRPKSPEDT